MSSEDMGACILTQATAISDDEAALGGQFGLLFAITPTARWMCGWVEADSMLSKGVKQTRKQMLLPDKPNKVKSRRTSEVKL